MKICQLKLKSFAKFPYFFLFSVAILENFKIWCPMMSKAAISCCLCRRISLVLIIRISVVISGCLWYNKAYCHVYFLLERGVSF
ncbi:hypothetical protein HMPREF1545_04112 [Oscillibacter sp. KLE 1728]|nr:hypothetical protein HMPREF1545_04112 [Oscillibacter sp. KLE 1728]ERK59058.1 hypothetical protein HMPREF1546_03527 [Oscillibacter sp. KLE 1745]